MDIQQEFDVSAPPQAVWDALKDLQLVASCLPGAQVSEVNAGNTHCLGRMSLRLGPIAVGFDGEATVVRDEAQRSAVLEGKGADRKSSSRAQMQMNYRVAPNGSTTRVSIDAKISLSGMLAQFSKGPIVNDVATQITRDFASQLQARLQPAQVELAGAPELAFAGATAVAGTRAPAVSAPALNPLSLLWRVFVYRISGGASKTSPGRIASDGAFYRLGLPTLFAVGVLVVWEVVVRAFGISEVLLPAPSAIWHRLVETLPLLLHHAWPTVWESVVGFIIASVLGVTLAGLLSASTLMRGMLYPNVVLFQLIPKIALAPLFIVWLGIGFQSRLAFSVFISFFPVVVAALAGLDNVDKSLLRLCRALTASNWQVFASVRLPYALPYVFSGMKIATTFAIIGVIVGEFITSQEGLGYLVLFASAQADTSLILAAITVLCIFGLCFYGLVALLERWMQHVFGA